MQDVVEAIEAIGGPLQDGDILLLHITSILSDDTPLAGEDVVVVEAGKGDSRGSPGSGKEQCKNGVDDKDANGASSCHTGLQRG